MTEKMPLLQWHDIGTILAHASFSHGSSSKFKARLGRFFSELLSRCGEPRQNARRTPERKVDRRYSRPRLRRGPARRPAGCEPTTPDACLPGTFGSAPNPSASMSRPSFDGIQIARIGDPPVWITFFHRLPKPWTAQGLTTLRTQRGQESNFAGLTMSIKNIYQKHNL